YLHRSGDAARPCRAPDLGTRRRPHQSLWHRRLCRPGQWRAHPTHGPQGQADPAGWRGDGRMAARRPCDPDRPGGTRMARPARSGHRRLDPERGRLMAVETLTFGCRLNAYESEVMKAEAEKAGLDNAVIINTCAVTAEAVRQAKQAVRKARRDHPQARIIVTGCAAQTEARSFGDMEEVDLVIGNADKLKAESYEPMVFGTPLNDKVQVNDIMS